MVRASSPVGEIRGILYAFLTVLAGIFITVVGFATYPIIKLIDPWLFFYHLMTTFFARVIIRFFGVSPVIKGRENIVRERGFIIVSNHQSDLDSNLISFAMHDVNFKPVFKKELCYFPGIGSTMYISGYIYVDREDKRKEGRSAMYDRCKEYLKNKVSVLLFPEGTRKISLTEVGNMGEFKFGAFKLAIESGAPLQPMSVSGARSLMSAFGKVPTLNFPDVGSPTVTIHPAIYPQPGDTVETLAARARKAISSGLRECDDVMPSLATLRKES